MQEKRRYTLNGSKLAMAYYEGFVQNGDALYSVDNGERTADPLSFSTVSATMRAAQNGGAFTAGVCFRRAALSEYMRLPWMRRKSRRTG